MNKLTKTYSIIKNMGFKEIINRVLSRINRETAHIFFRNISKKNIIVLKNRVNQDYSDNCLALFQYLIKNKYNEKYKIVWIVSNKKNFKNYKINNVSFVTGEHNGFTSLIAYYYGMVAKYFIYTNNNANINKYKNSQQIEINLWHGCGYKDKENKNKLYKATFDYAIVPGDLFVKTKSKFWSCSEDKILPLGYPRYDWFNITNEKGNEIRNKLSVNNNKLLIWMPTFRYFIDKGNKTDRIELDYFIPGLKSEYELIQLNSYCKDNDTIIVIKAHPCEKNWKNIDGLSNILVVTNQYLKDKNINLYNLLAVSDGLISDYSSVAVDYMLLNKPIGFVIADFQLYKDNRGFIFDNPLDYMPGDKIKDLEDLKKFVYNTKNSNDMYNNKRNELMPLFHNVSNSYCEKIVKHFNL